MNIAIFASGQGTNFSAIVRQIKKGRIPADIRLLVCDNPRAYVIKRAERARIKIALILREEFGSRKEFENKIIRALEKNNIKLIVLAGFMRILSARFIKRFRNRILNVHPAILPSFKGAHAIADAFSYGVKITGVTIHFVDQKIDHGPIILQGAIKVKATDTEESLEARIHRLEHKLYPEAIKLFSQGRLKIKGRRAWIIPR
ncbi:MAG: phosphoribosylglycinamide formyltransferase [Candidatus Omnitrophica bacterium]|nr:phosphoribosylglycinamide formyltransferase [Candidatus Omnitrophota bacterium]